MERIDLSGEWRMQALAEGGEGLSAERPEAPPVTITDTWEALGLEGFEGTVLFHRALELPDTTPALALLLGPTRHGWVRLYADGRLVGEIGSPQHPFPQPLPRLFPLDGEAADRGTLELLLEFHRVAWASDEVATENGPVEGGLLLGAEEDLAEYHELLESRRLLGGLFSLGFGVAFLLVGLYHLQLYTRRRSQAGYLWFGLGAVAFSANALLLSTWPTLLFQEFTLPYRLTDATGHLAAAFLLGFLWEALDREPPTILRGYQWSHAVLGALLLVVPFQWAWGSALPRFFWLVPALVVGLVWVVRGVREGHPEALPLLVGGIILAACELGELLRVAGLPLPTLLPNLGFLALVISMVVTLSNRFSRVHEEVDGLRQDLEERVDERTASLSEAVRALEALSAAKSRFLAHMSHELRTPLNAIIGFANVLKKDRKRLGERNARLAERISVSGLRLMDIVEELLDLSRIEEGRMELSIEPTDVGEIVQVAADQLGEFARQKGLEWRVQIPAGLSPSLLDRHHFIQILTNLMGNAIKFTDVGGVEIRLIAEGHRAVAVEVEDTGVGIPEEALPFIFEAYERMQAPHTRNVEGTGLGLAISRSLAELMGCSLEVESTVGEGSTFRLNLPL